ncbi:MAG TPA: TAXI family TRAP transporter solute-binding subunit [Pseudolabrys sp.]|nr:TAXI family TRAP transporter solute-binding subunit [Pseudolabrys sp.]
MHRRLTRSFLAALGLGAALIGGTVAVSAEPLKVTLAGGSVGGAWSAMGAAIGQTIRLAAPGSSFTYEPGRDAANVQLVSQGKVQLGITHAQMALRAIKGTAPFKSKITNIRAIALLDPQATVQIVVPKNSPFTSLEQIAKAKKPIRVALNKRGTMMAIAGEEVFKAAGFTAKDIAAWGGRIEYVSFNSGLDMLKNGQVDLVLNMLAFPSAQLDRLAHDMAVKLLPIPDSVAAKINSEIGTKSITIPAKTYSFEPQAVPTVTGYVVLVASDKMPDVEVETITKAMINHYDYLTKAYPSFARMGKKSLPDVAPLTLAPGAKKAYKSAGLE